MWGHKASEVRPVTAPSGTAPSKAAETEESNGVPRTRSHFNLEKLQELYTSKTEFFKEEEDDDGDDDKHNAEQSVVPSSPSKPGGGTMRMAVVRYFLDRPGYGVHNSSARFWFHPPAACTPRHVRQFLQTQQIALGGLLVEVYLDKVGSFMMLQAIEAAFVEWDFATATPDNPAVLLVRLTDVDEAREEERNALMGGGGGSSSASVATSHKSHATSSSAPTLANTVPAGLFSFSLMTVMETAELTGLLVSGSIEEPYILIWGPYMFFLGGLLQVFVGLSQIWRNNLYGTVAFLGFGCIWMGNGASAILRTFFASEDTVSFDLLGREDPWGHFIRIFWILLFCVALEIQTWTMNKLSSLLIAILCVKLFFQSLTGWSLAAEWCQLIVGYILAVYAFYVFLVEFTNGVYKRSVFDTYKWSEEHSPEEVFGAPGRTGTLHSKATRLRQANYWRVQKGGLREVPPPDAAD